MNPLKNDSHNPSELPLIHSDFNIFNWGSDSKYVNSYRMFLGYYNMIPNCRSIDCIDVLLFKNWFELKYKKQIIKQHYKQYFDSLKMELEFIDHFYFLERGIMLNIFRNNINILFTAEQEISVNILFEECKKFIKSPKNTTDISLIILQNKELGTKRRLMDFTFFTDNLEKSNISFPKNGV